MVSPLLAELPKEDRRRVLLATRRRRYGRHEVISHQGDPGDTLHVIAKGGVAVPVATPLGDTTTLTMLGPGSSLGASTTRNQAVRIATVTALEPTELLTVCQLSSTSFAATTRPLIASSSPSSPSSQTPVQELLEALFVNTETRVLCNAEAAGAIRTARARTEIVALSVPIDGRGNLVGA